MDSKAQIACLALMISVSMADECLGQAYPMPPPPIPASLPPPRMPQSITARDYRQGSRPKPKTQAEIDRERNAHQAQLLRGQALQALQDHDWVKADKACVDALALAPDLNICWSLAGIARFNQQDYAGARLAFGAAVARNPDDVAAIGQLGITLALLGDPEAARGWLEALRARSAACGPSCANRTVISAGIAGIEAALAPKG